MAVTVRGTGWGGASTITSDLLVSYITQEIRVLEPMLQFARLGVQQDVPKGRDRLLFPQTNQIGVNTGQTISSQTFASLYGMGASLAAVTTGVAAITEGTNPTAQTWGATSYAVGPSQFGIIVQVSDLLVHGSAIGVIDGAVMQVKNSIAREVDDAIQAVVNAGTNGVIYAGGKTTRASLAVGDIATQDLFVKAVRNLRSANAAGLQPFDGNYYVGVIHSSVEYDLMSNTSSGGFLDLARYANVDAIYKGAVGDFRGIRFLQSANVNYFNSTTNVFPTTIVGKNSFGWGYFQPPTPVLITTPDAYNPLNLYNTIGGKVTLGITRFEDSTTTARIARIESAVTV